MFVSHTNTHTQNGMESIPNTISGCTCASSLFLFDSIVEKIEKGNGVENSVFCENKTPFDYIIHASTNI